MDGAAERSAKMKPCKDLAAGAGEKDSLSQNANFGASPHRVQLSRRKGWRMPPNTVKVDRSTKWGNPFIVGKHGTRAECVRLFTLLLGGYICLSCGDPDEQQAYRTMAVRDRGELKGKNLACWCPADAPCHANVLLGIRHTA